MKIREFQIYSFYRFFNHKKKRETKKKLDLFISDKLIRGTVLLADEGINGTISGEKKDLDKIISFIRKILKIRKLNIKINQNSFLPFNRIKIRLKKEIVSLGEGPIDVCKNGAELINPSDWNKVIKDKSTKVIDVRNQFEIEIGKFQNAFNPKTKSFRDFPNRIKEMQLSKDTKIAMYCTGGIRCEKASAYLKINGYKNIVQLNGGIINYLNYQKEKGDANLWKGECFVFDERVTINKNLIKGRYIQCYGCRRPITSEDTKSINYIKGVSCPYCINERTSKQKNKSRSRQKQLDIAREKNVSHTQKKIFA